jgi:PAS domain S-box-containing protein
MKAMKFPTAAEMERWPWAVRALLGCALACLVQSLTYLLQPLHSFPMALAVPAVILSFWFLGMWGGVLCTLTDAILADLLLLGRAHIQFPAPDVPQRLRMAVFFGVTVLLGWAIRRLAQQRTLLQTQELERKLILAHTDRQLAEERARVSEVVRERGDLLKIALEVNDMGLWVVDIGQGTTYWSDTKFRLVGLEPGSIDPSRGAWLHLVHPEDVEGVKEALARARKSGIDYHQQYRVVWPDGTVRWVESQGKCQRDSDGKAVRVVGVLADITNRKLTEDAMLRTEKLAVAGRMAAAVAHEINNPLEAVGNLLYLITVAKSIEVARPQARQALDELMRVSLITRQTLMLHRQAGTPSVTRLSESVAVVLELFRPKLRAAGITAQVRAVREAGVECVPSEIHQIFASLISNAIDAMPRGGRIEVRLRPSRDWRNSSTEGMRVTFRDTGVGMSRATMRRIFEPFFTTKMETGTGLGLWVVAQLTERLHGQIRVWSRQREPARGTAFSLFLPYGETPESSGSYD